MEISLQSGRPRKRIKYECNGDTILMDTTIANTDTAKSSYDTIVGDLSYYSTPLSPIGDSMFSSTLITYDTDNQGISGTLDLRAAQSVPLFEPISPPSPPLHQFARSNQQTVELHRLLPSATFPARGSFACSPGPNGQGFVVSPFTVDGGRLTVSTVPSFNRPDNGQINSYIKFHWPSRTPSRRHSSSVLSAPENSVENISSTEAKESVAISCRSRRISPPRAMLPTVTEIVSNVAIHTILTARFSPESSSIPIDDWLFQSPDMSNPRMLPPQFGSQAKMDPIGRRLFEFYIKNWCPGRSVLNETNLWLKDLAPMHENNGILYAIQSLAGIYVYDYLPNERVRNIINQRYVLADKYFNKLLNSPRETGEGAEVVTMAVLLSMQDIILTERRRKKPYTPRWLEGFKQAEGLLQETDPGARYWKNKNIQYNRLRISQSIMVGRAVILTQVMTPLPPPTMDPESEAGRFGWLLYGTEKDVSEIHGGCGFSQKLLHIMSQISYCAARFQQEPRSTLVPITARFLDRQLSSMRQWSRELESDTQGAAERHAHTIEWVRQKPDDEVIDSSQDMTEVTAEAWKISIIIYFQCRLLRLPRNHPHVVANLDDLSKCVRIMPTSGSHFTAQAPLLPVFLLGMLATHHGHKSIAQNWFAQVVQTPARSSVPPLYRALQRIWVWINTEIELPAKPSNIPKLIGMRYPWWELLVTKVMEKEEEILCLT